MPLLISVVDTFLVKERQQNASTLREAKPAYTRKLRASMPEAPPLPWKKTVERSCMKDMVPNALINLFPLYEDVRKKTR